MLIDTSEPNPASSDSGSELGEEYFCEHPHKVWVLWLYEEMQQQGFYTPHVSINHRSRW